MAAACFMTATFSGCDLQEWVYCSIDYAVCHAAETDRQAPGTPTGLTATPGDGYVSLAWTPSPASDVVEHVVLRATQPGGPYTAPITVRGRGGSGGVDTGRTNGTTYYYRVYAVDAAGNESKRSPEVSATPASGLGPSRSPILQWGGEGSGDGQFFYPRGIATAPSGQVYVADAQNHRIERFGPTGNFLGKWGSEGSGDGQFRQPIGIAVDSAGIVYVTDAVRDDVQKFSVEGTFIARWTGTPTQNFDVPTGIATATGGDVYVVNNGGQRVDRFTSAGAFVSSWGGPFFSSGPGFFHDPDGIAVDPIGNVYVSENSNHRVQKFTASGEFISGWGTQGTGDGQFNIPGGVAFTPGGTVFVADTANNRIQEFSSSGAFVSKFGSAGHSTTQFQYPYGVATDCRSRLYVVDTYNHRVLVFGDPAGQPPPCTSTPHGKRLANPSKLVLASGAGRFRARFSTSSLKHGKRVLTANRLRETGIVAAGRFSGKLTRGQPASAALRFFRAGRWRAQFDVSYNARTRKGSATGWSLATSKNKRGGRVCLRFTTKYRIVRKRARLSGTFRTRGGTRAGAKLVASGHFTQTYAAKKPFVLSGSGKTGSGRARGLPRQCRKL
jgi:sugar lactone lactonase YvrE